MRTKFFTWLLFATTALLNLGVATVPAAAQTSTSTKAAQARAAQKYGNLPLTFEANQGQTDPKVRFLSRGRGYTAFLTVDSMVLSLRPTKAAVASNQSNARQTLQFKLVGAATSPAVIGEDPQPGRVNYFFGKNPAKWHTNVPTYAKVRYKNIYPGIDLVYYGNHRELEYDFEVFPGADPGKIQFEVQGTNQIQFDEENNLLLKMKDGGAVNLQSPVVYQESNGQRVRVDGSYLVKDASHVAFQVANYDSNKPLVIDPVLVYSTYLGGSGNDQATGIAVDTTGSVYLAGYTDSVDFPLATIGALPGNTNHVFVTKLDATGSNLVYADYIGGSSADYGVGLVLDQSNNVYVTGSTTSNDFPVVSAYQAVQPGPYSGFLTKVSANGSSLLYSTYLGGNTFDQPAGIAIDSLGHVYVAGSTMSQNFPVAAAYQSTVSANQGSLFGYYGFLTKFSTNGSSLDYSTYLAGNSNVVQDCGSPCWPVPYSGISAVAVDANGNAYVTGGTNTYNFPVTSGSYLTTNTTDQDPTVGFVAKFSNSGSLSYSTYFYGSGGAPVAAAAIAVDGSGNAAIAGTVVSEGTFPVTSTGICDPEVDGFNCSYAFVSKFDTTGSTLLYSTFLGPNNFASPQAIALDASGNTYVLSSTFSSSFTTNNAVESYAGNRDLLLVEIDPSASTQLFATFLGGAGNDSPGGMALDASGNIYVAGYSDSSDFPVMQNAFQTISGGNSDAFVVKLGLESAPAVAVAPFSLQFSTQAVGTTSTAKTALLRNMGSASLSISSIAVSGDFSETDDCGSSVPAAGTCTLSVSFAPTAPGTRTGSLVIHDDAAGTQQTLSLSGSATGVVVVVAPTSLNFGNVTVSSISSAQTVTLSNNGNIALSISSIQVSSSYQQTNTCGSSLAAASSCTISVKFAPTATGTQGGTLTITDSATSSPQTVTLTGNGTAASTDFSISNTSGSVTIKAGSTASYTLNIAAVGGSFSSSVALSCTGAPSGTTCSFSPSSVTPGSSSATATLTIKTAAASASIAEPVHTASSSDHSSVPSGKAPIYLAFLQLQGVGLFGMVLAGSKTKKGSKRMRMIVLLIVVFAALMLMTGCAGGTGIVNPPGGGTTPGSYTVVVTGKSGSLQHSVNLTLTVQ